MNENERHLVTMTWAITNNVAEGLEDIADNIAALELSLPPDDYIAVSDALDAITGSIQLLFGYLWSWKEGNE